MAAMASTTSSTTTRAMPRSFRNAARYSMGLSLLRCSDQLRCGDHVARRHAGKRRSAILRGERVVILRGARHTGVRELVRRGAGGDADIRVAPVRIIPETPPQDVAVDVLLSGVLVDGRAPGDAHGGGP